MNTSHRSGYGQTRHAVLAVAASCRLPAGLCRRNAAPLRCPIIVMLRGPGVPWLAASSSRWRNSSRAKFLWICHSSLEPVATCAVVALAAWSTKASRSKDGPYRGGNWDSLNTCFLC